MSGMCATKSCFDAALPNSDYCAACEQQLGQVLDFKARVAKYHHPHTAVEVEEEEGCMFGVSWCHGPDAHECCVDCAEFGPKSAA